MPIFYIYFTFILTVLTGIVVYLFIRSKRRKRILDLLQLKLFLVRLPYSVKEQVKDVKDEINFTEQLISSFATFKKPFIFEVAVPHVGEEIHFYVAVPASLGEVLARQVQSIWSEAEVKEVDDYNIFNYSGVTVGALVRQRQRFILPIRTYQEMNADTFLPIVGGLAKVNEIGEGAAFQLVVRPAPHYKKHIFSALNALKKGWKLKDVLNNPFSISISDFAEALRGKSNEEPKEKIIDELAVKALEMKLAKPLFEVNIRLVASASNQLQAETLLSSLTEGFAQFGAPNRNELKVIRLKNINKLVHQFSFRLFDESQAVILNSEELASIFHFPTSFTAIPKIKHLKSREAPPPANLANDGILIGFSSFRGESKEIKISDEDRRRHLYIIGQTGTGKSNLITNMAVADIKKGKGLAVLDPHGDLIENILGLVPQSRFEDVIFFDPGDLSRPIGINMFEYDFNRPEEKTFIVNELVNIFDKLYDLKQTGGPMFEQYMRNAVLLLLEDAVNEPATLMEVPRVFSDTDFRNRKLERIKNPVVIDFWEKEAIKVGGEASLANITPYITSKFNTFIANDYMRPIIGQVRSAFDFREVIDNGKILLVNLSKGRIGDINANLIGMIIVGKLLKAALSRVDIPQEKRRDFYLYIDEFQNFTTDSIAVILSEARKYRLNLIIAHQFIAQLPEKIRDAVFGNVGSIISFRVGAADAEFLVKQFEPVFNEQDLINIDNFNAYVKFLVYGQTVKPFNIKTIAAERGDLKLAEKLKELSKLKYGRPREEVEMEIFQRLRQ